MLRITVEDANTGAAITAAMTIVVYSAEPVDSVVLTLPEAATRDRVTIFEGARPEWGAGRYSVEVRVAGYQTWRRDQILVQEEAACHHTKARSIAVQMTNMND